MVVNDGCSIRILRRCDPVCAVDDTDQSWCVHSGRIGDQPGPVARVHGDVLRVGVRTQHHVPAADVDDVELCAVAVAAAVSDAT